MEPNVKNREKKAARAVALTTGKAILGTLRFGLYVLLLLAGRVLAPIANCAVVVGLVVFLFCLIFRRDQVTPMWAGAAVAFCSMALLSLYYKLLRFVAPVGTLIISEV
jgi:hypothetical protein